MSHFRQILLSLTRSYICRPLVCICHYHSSPCLQYKGGRPARRLAKLEKLLTKKKKKFYYDPMNVAQLGKLATGVPSRTKTRSEDSIRLRTYNKILCDNISDMMTTSFISEELEQLQLTVLGARVSGDMSACRVYWQSTGDVKEDDRIEEVLNRHKSPLRRALVSHRVLGKIPPIFFLKDKASANLSEIDRLLALADFGPEEDAEGMESETSKIDSNTGRMEFIKKTSQGEGEVSGWSHQPSLFGIDHDALNRLIKHSDQGTLQEGPVGKKLEATDKRFQELRGIMKKKKLGKTERKEATFYKGELEGYASSRREEFTEDVVEDKTQTESEESFADEGYDDEKLEDYGSEEYEDDHTSPNEQTDK